MVSSRVYVCVCAAANVQRLLTQRVNTAIGASMALSTSTQYAGAEDFFLLFGLYTRGGEIFLPASDELLC